MYTLTQTVTASQTDRNRAMKLGAIFDMMADCEQFQVDNEPGLNTYTAQKNVGIFLVSRQTDILRRAKMSETLTVGTSIYELSPATGKRNTLVRDEGGAVIVRSFAIGAFVDLSTGQMTALDRAYVKGFPLEAAAEMEYLPRKIILPDTAPEFAPALSVPRYFIDSYGHVNNAKYIMQAAEYLEAESAVSRVRVEYKTSARMGDTMLPLLYRTDDSLTVVFTDPNRETVYAIIEFT